MVTRRRGRARTARRNQDGIARDDAVVEALARRRPVPDGTDDGVVALLAGWCAQIDRDLEPDRTGRDVVARPWPARGARRGSGGLARRRVVAAGVLGVVTLAGLLAGGQARRDQPTPPRSGVVDSGRAVSVAASGQVSDALARAGRLLSQGRLTEAERTLRQAREILARVRPADGRAALVARLDRMESRLGQARLRAGTAPTTSPTDPASSTDPANPADPVNPVNPTGPTSPVGSAPGTGPPTGTPHPPVPGPSNGAANGNGHGNGHGRSTGHATGNGHPSAHAPARSRPARAPGSSPPAAGTTRPAPRRAPQASTPSA